jgi:hypothetical protein
VRIGRAFEYGADQPGFERSEKLHGFDRCFPSLFEQLGLTVGEKQALMFTQRLLDFQVARECLRIEDAQSLGSLQFGVMEITDAVLAHQASGFLGYA